MVGKATHGDAEKAKRPLAAILRYLTLLNDQILEAFPAGTVPPVEEVTLRTAAEMEPYLREPLSEGWKPVYALPAIGQNTDCRPWSGGGLQPAARSFSSELWRASRDEQDESAGLEKPGKIQLKEIPVPEVTQPDDVLIEVAACGVCGTDIKTLEGKHVYAENTVLGHEFNGTVVAVGPTVTTLKVGDRVSVDNNIRCGVRSFAASASTASASRSPRAPSAWP